MVNNRLPQLATDCAFDIGMGITDVQVCFISLSAARS
jgi:hypothetical protein